MLFVGVVQRRWRNSVCVVRVLRVPVGPKSGDRFAMTNRKAPLAKKGKPNIEIRPDAIEAKRDQQLAEIEKIRTRRGKLEGCSKNAYLMLTRGWGRASWHVRAELLKASGWLLYIERLRDLWPEG